MVNIKLNKFSVKYITIKMSHAFIIRVKRAVILFRRCSTETMKPSIIFNNNRE